MSTLRLDTIQDQSGSNASTPSEIFSGRAKAWVNFKGTGTVAIRASYNVSSITDNGTGNYTVNFTTAMPDANYAATFGGWNNGTGNGGWFSTGSGGGSYPSGIATTSVQVFSYSSAGADQDNDAIYVSIFR